MFSAREQDFGRVLVGVDEAGRGPVVGDMVVAAVAIPAVLENTLAEIGVRDSKELTPERRKAVYKRLLEAGVTAVIAYIPPWILDSYNLNDVETEYIGRVLRALSKLVTKLKPREVCVEVDEVKGRGEVIKRSAFAEFKLIEKVEVVVEPHADARYVAVATASIVAKVSRDLSLEPLRRLVGDFGSGYASDSRTREWITSTHATSPESPVFVRRSWNTLRNIAPYWYIEKRKRVSKVRTLLDYTKR